jgi:hypothetical protein
MNPGYTDMIPALQDGKGLWYGRGQVYTNEDQGKRN